MIPKKRKSPPKGRTEAAMIGTTPLETIDVDGDYTLRLTHSPRKEEDTDDSMSGISTRADADGGDSIVVQERWKPSGFIDLLVSAKHLTLVSCVFKQMIGQTPELLILPHDDLNAFKILLNIIHGRARQVPLKIDLDMLHNIALIVEKYEMVEVAEIYVKLWLLEIPPLAETGFESDLLQWLSVCWIFKLPAEFTRITRHAIWHTSCQLEIPANKKYGFPTRILEKIENERKYIIYTLVYMVKGITNRYIHEWACDAMSLGSLIKSAISVNMWPIPQDPYHGLTVLNVTKSARCLKITSLCDTVGKIAPEEDRGAHGYNKSIKRSIGNREDEARGFDLEDF